MFFMKQVEVTKMKRQTLHLTGDGRPALIAVSL